MSKTANTMSFNRYMVECECGKIYSEPALGESF